MNPVENRVRQQVAALHYSRRPIATRRRTLHMLLMMVRERETELQHLHKRASCSLKLCMCVCLFAHLPVHTLGGHSEILHLHIFCYCKFSCLCRLQKHKNTILNTMYHSKYHSFFFFFAFAFAL